MIWSTGSIHKIEMQQPVGSASTPSGEILEVYQADDQPHWQGNGQDHGFTYNSTIGQVIWGIDDTVAGNEPVINFVTVDASVNPTVDPAAPATPLTNTQPTLCVWGDVGAAASYTFIQGGTGITNGTTRFRALTNSLGVDVDINVISPVIDINANVLAGGTFIDISYAAIQTTTSDLYLMNVFSAVNLLTLGADLYGINLDFSTARVTAAADRDIFGYRVALPALAQTTAVTTNYRGFQIPSAGAISDSSTTAFNWYGTDLVLPAGTVTGTATMTIVGHRIATAGALNTSTAAGFIDWYGMDIVTPTATAAGVFAQIIDVSGFRIGTAGALNSNDALQTINWRGIDVLMPQVATATGTTTVSGLYVRSFTGALLGTNYALNLDWRSTSGTISNTAFGAATVLAGAVTGYLLDLTTNVTAGANAVIGADIRIPATSSATTRAIDIDYRATAGNIIEADIGFATTLTGALVGINVNLNTNLTPAGTFGSTGFQTATPAYTQATADTTTLRGFYINTAGALAQTTAAGILNWYGQEIVTPATTVSFAGASANINVFRVGTAGALTTDTGAGTLNYSVGVFTLPNVTQTLGQTNVIVLDINAGTLAVADNSTTGAVYRGIDVSLPALTLNTPTGANAVNISGYRIDTAGAIITQDANSTINWTGMYIISPAITQTAGSIVAYGINLDLDAAVTTGGTLRGINAVMQGTYTTANEMFINATGDARLIQVLNTSNAMLLSPSSAGEGTDIAFNVLEADTILLDFGIDKFPTGSVIVVGYDAIETSTGNIKVLEFTNAAALTLGGDLFGIDLDFASNVTVATDQDITGYNLTLPAITQSAANTTSYIGYQIDTAGALVVDTAGAGNIINHYGINVVTPQSTISFAAAAITTTVLRQGTAGALASSTAGTHNWYGIDLVAPVSTTTGTATTNITMFRTATAGALEINTAAGTTNWRGLHILSPAVTETSGDINVFGIDLDMDAVITTGGTLTGINLVLQNTYTTANEIGIIVQGDGRLTHINTTAQNFLSRPTTVDTGVDVAIDSLASPIIDIGADIFTGGTFIDIAYDSGEVLESALVGMNVNFGTNLTPAGTFGTTGFQTSTPAYTQSTGDATTFYGFRLNTAGAISQGAGGGTINWRAINLVTPNVTATTGTVTVLGLQHDTTSTITSNPSGAVNWYGQNWVLPALSSNDATVLIHNIVGFRNAITGALVSSNANATIYWTGALITAPAITQTLGVTRVYGIDLDMDAAVTTGGTVRGINLAMQSTYTTANEIGINITGDGRTIEIANTENAIDIIGAQSATGLIDLNPNGTAAGTVIDITATAVVLVGAPVGINVDLSAATMANISSTGFSFNLNEAVTHTTAAGEYTHQNTITGGTITVSPASGATIANWRGLNITMPTTLTATAVITETATINAYGLLITVGAPTLSGSGGTETINQAAIRILDSTSADNLDFHHDGSSAILSSNTAIDILSTGDTDDFIRFQAITNVPGFHSRGATNLDIQNNNDAGGAIYDVTFFANQLVPAATPATGATPELRIYGWSSATINTQVFSVIRTSALNEAVAETGDEVAVMRIHPANNRLVISEADNIEFTSASTAPVLMLYDAGGTDYLQIYDSGSYSFIASNPNNIRFATGINSAQSRRFMCGYDGAAPTLAGGGILAHTGVGGTAWAAGNYTLTTPGAGDATAGYWQMGAIADEILFSIPLPELQVDTSVEGEFTIQIYITNPAGTDRFDYAIYDWDGTPLAVGVDQAIGGTAQEYSINLGALAWSKGDSLIIALRGFESVAPAAIDARIFYIDYTYEVGIENNIA